MKFFKYASLFLILSMSSTNAWPSDLSCMVEQTKQTLAQLSRKARMLSKDVGQFASRQPKIWNPHPEGMGIPKKYMESADLTRPMPFVPGRTFIIESELSGANVVSRIDASGENAFQAPSVEDFLKGDRDRIERITVVRQYADGTRTHGPYHTGNLGWDGLRGYVPVELEANFDLNAWYANARRQVSARSKNQWKVVKLRARLRGAGVADTGLFDVQLTVKDLMQAIEAAKQARGPLGSTKKLPGLLNTAWQGLLEQPNKMVGAQAAGITSAEPIISMNYSRTRHGLQVLHINGQEIWIDQGSITDSKPNIHWDWISDVPEHRVPGENPNEYYVVHDQVQAEHEHGYGGRPLMDENGILVAYDGTYWMIYERVTAMKVIHHPNGHIEKLPWKTQNFARRMKNPFKVFQAGEKLPDGRPADTMVLMTGVAPEAHPNEPYKTSDRHGMGYLVEGLNVMGQSAIIGANGDVRAAPLIATRPKATSAGSEHHVILATDSQGNYVEEYGCYLAWRDSSEGPIGRYRHVLNEEGQPFNFVREFAKRNEMTWVGRADLFFNQGKLWAVAHGVDIGSLPTGFPAEGWPTAHQFEYYLRAGLILPLELTWKNGQPWVRVVDP